MAKKKIAILTGGGDCPGLNPAIRGVVLKAHKLGYECLGIQEGWKGMINGTAKPIGPDDVREMIGRGGMFKYNNQDHSILMGILAAENIAGEAAHDLWEINTDYDTFQEGGPQPDIDLLGG